MAATFAIPQSQQATRADHIGGRYDPWLLTLMLTIAALGVVMVTSSSMAIADSRGLSLFHYAFRHAMYLGIGIAVAVWLAGLELRQLEAVNRLLPPLCVLLLLLVLVPGLGHTVKGARRWISLGFIGFQPAEAAKLLLVIWLASYLKRFSDEVRATWTAMIKPFAVAGLFAAILLGVHKDFGTSALILGITAGMLVLGGVHLPRMMVPLACALPVLALMILLEPYRVQRLISFSDPWKDPFGSGYQLTNALMAVGRGEFWGVGLGGSVQKLSYLPEAYTDFIMAVIAEELGFVGVCVVIALYTALVIRALQIGLRCIEMRRHFAGNLAFGIGLWTALQSFVSIGVNLGVLPTKGLTLPLISSGGSSVIVTCAAWALLLRVSYELDRAQRQKAVSRGHAAQEFTEPVAVTESSPGDGDDPRAVAGQRVAQWMDGLRRRGARTSAPAPRERREPTLATGDAP